MPPAIGVPAVGAVLLIVGVLVLQPPSLDEQLAAVAADVREVRTAAAALRRVAERAGAAPEGGGGGAAALTAAAAAANLSAAAALLRGTGGARRDQRLDPPLRRALRWRWELAQVLEEEGKRHGAEIGVQQAKFSYDTLRLWPSCKTYILIDVWKPQEHYTEEANVNQRGQDALYEIALNRLKQWKEKLVVLRNWSHDASFRVEDGTLDFVYVDARHDFESALEDMRDWWPKLRKGGIFSGHDYTTAGRVPGFATQRDGSRDIRAVVGAVEQFSAEVSRRVYVIPENKPGKKKQPFASWVMRK